MLDRGRIDRVIKEHAFAQTGLVDPKAAVPVGKLLQAQTLALSPNDAEAWSDLWFATSNDKDPDHAYILKALELNPDLAGAHLSRGLALYKLRRYEEAMAEYREALRLNPDYPDARSNLETVRSKIK